MNSRRDGHTKRKKRTVKWSNRQVLNAFKLIRTEVDGEEIKPDPKHLQKFRKRISMTTGKQCKEPDAVDSYVRHILRQSGHDLDIGEKVSLQFKSPISRHNPKNVYDWFDFPNFHHSTNYIVKRDDNSSGFWIHRIKPTGDDEVDDAFYDAEPSVSIVLFMVEHVQETTENNYRSTYKLQTSMEKTFEHGARRRKNRSAIAGRGTKLKTIDMSIGPNAKFERY